MGLVIFIIFWLGWHIGMYSMLVKAGGDKTKALIPIYNTWEVVKLCSIPKIWFWLQLVPILGQFISLWISIIFTMHFKKVNVIQHALVVFFPFIYLPYLGFSKKEKWHGEQALAHYHKPASR